MKHEKWYQVRLSKYFTENYEVYEDVVEFWNNPDINQWMFDIPELGRRVTLMCTDTGNVVEDREGILVKITDLTEEIYEKVKASCGSFDAIYEDHIVSLVGEHGLDILRAAKKLEGCGYLNGRNLYTLA